MGQTGTTTVNAVILMLRNTQVVKVEVTAVTEHLRAILYQIQIKFTVGFLGEYMFWKMSAPFKCLIEELF